MLKRADDYQDEEDVVRLEQYMVDDTKRKYQVPVYRGGSVESLLYTIREFNDVVWCTVLLASRPAHLPSRLLVSLT